MIDCLKARGKEQNMEISNAQINERHVMTDMNKNLETDINENHELVEMEVIDEHELEWVCTLGMGAFANVELVRFKNKQFALKKFKQFALHQQEFTKQIENETQILKNCRGSKFVVKCYGPIISNSSFPGLLLELCLGGDLWSVMQKCGLLSEDKARFYSACVIEGLKYLENCGIFYRDMKPENLLMDEAGYVKIADLGLSKLVRKDEERTFTVVGTAEYLAPEMLTNHGYGTESTLWSLGILIYEMLTGNPPFVSEDQKVLFSKIQMGFYRFSFPKILKSNAIELINMLCRPKPSHRPSLDMITRFMWYTGFNWDALRKGTLKPPFQPNKLDKLSLDENFDNF